jgi:myo-inositol-1(or 4)-monophosphatase
VTAADLELAAAAAAAAAAALAEMGEWLAGHQDQVARWSTWSEFRVPFDRMDAPAARMLGAAPRRLTPRADWVDEFGDQLPDGECWFVEPIDGAVQYLQGLSQWSLTATLVRGGLPAVTVLHAPLRGETYSAVAGAGATRNGSPVHPSAKAELGIALVVIGHPPFVTGQPGVAERSGLSLSAVLAAAGAVRNLGPTSWQIAEVGAGRLDGFWQFGRDASNLVGAALVASEAGAIVTDARGEVWTAGSESFVAAAPGLHGPLVEVLSAATSGPPVFLGPRVRFPSSP